MSQFCCECESRCIARSRNNPNITVRFTSGSLRSKPSSWVRAHATGNRRQRASTDYQTAPRPRSDGVPLEHFSVRLTYDFARRSAVISLRAVRGSGGARPRRSLEDRVEVTQAASINFRGRVTTYRRRAAEAAVNHSLGQQRSKPVCWSVPELTARRRDVVNTCTGLRLRFRNETIDLTRPSHGRTAAIVEAMKSRPKRAATPSANKVSTSAVAHVANRFAYSRFPGE
jgi:hypothetical protein